MFVDRSFESLQSVVEASYGRIASGLLKILSFNSWKFHSTKNYIYANTYKVMGCDPQDALIFDNSSLKNGVTKELIYSEATRKENRISIGPNKRRQAKEINMDEYCHIINKEETKGFFGALKYCYEMILEFASSDTQRKTKKIINNDQENPKRAEDDVIIYEANSKEHHLSPESHEGDAIFDGRQSNIPTDRSLTENELLNNNGDYTDTFNASGVLNLSDTFDMQDTGIEEEEKTNTKRQRKEKKKQERREKFSSFDDRRDPTDYDLINRFLLRVHKYLDKLDSGGRTLRQIFALNDKYQLEAFRYFIMNLEVYGSFSPLNDRYYDPQVTRISSYLKISKVRKGLDALINEFEGIDGKIFKDVWLKTRMASYYFNKIEAFLSRKHRQSSHKKQEDKKTFFIDYDLDLQPQEEKKNSSTNIDFESSYGDGTRNSTPRSGLSVVEDDEDEYYYVKTLFKDFTEPDAMMSGYLIPLTCGHNGTYSPKERSLLETHLRQSGFLV